MIFDDALKLVQSGKAVFSESLGLTMFTKFEKDRLTFVRRQRNVAPTPITQSEFTQMAALAGDWKLSGVELS